jgi:hypothetical protein
MKILIGLVQIVLYVVLIGSGLILAQPNPAIPYTMGTGCVTVEVSPVSGTVLSVSNANAISLTFNQNVEYVIMTTEY